MEFVNTLSEEEIKKIGKIAHPIECIAAHGIDRPSCSMIATQQSGKYFYEFYKDVSGAYFYKEYVKENGRLIPYDDAIFGPIRAAAKARRKQIEDREKKESADKHEEKLRELRKRLIGEEKEYR